VPTAFIPPLDAVVAPPLETIVAPPVEAADEPPLLVEGVFEIELPLQPTRASAMNTRVLFMLPSFPFRA
jgi:hypothetical protein